MFNLTKLEFIGNRDDFKAVCPIMLYNFEIGYCDLDDEPKVLSSLQGWPFIFN